jgi:hypothetical protein
MNIKIFTISLAVFLFSLAPVSAQFPSEVRQTINDALADAVRQLAQAGIPTDEPISVFPIRGDQDGFVEGILKNAVTRAGLTYVEGREDPIYTEVIAAEMEHDARRADILDPGTLDRLGELRSTRLLLYGAVREAVKTDRQIYVEIELHLTRIRTKEHLWGELVTRRVYLPADVTGIVTLDTQVRRLLQESINQYVDSVRRNDRLQALPNVAIAPIAGDIDGYIANLAESLLSSAQVTPNRIDVATMGEIRNVLRDDPRAPAAILTGAVRDLSRELKMTTPLERTYELTAEVQLRIEEAGTGNVLWSQTILAQRDYTDKIGLWDFLLANLLIVAIVGGALLGFILLLLFLMATRRSR